MKRACLVLLTVACLVPGLGAAPAPASGKHAALIDPVKIVVPPAEGEKPDQTLNEDEQRAVARFLLAAAAIAFENVNQTGKMSTLDIGLIVGYMNAQMDPELPVIFRRFCMSMIEYEKECTSAKKTPSPEEVTAGIDKLVAQFNENLSLYGLTLKDMVLACITPYVERARKTTATQEFKTEEDKTRAIAREFIRLVKIDLPLIEPTGED